MPGLLRVWARPDGVTYGASDRSGWRGPHLWSRQQLRRQRRSGWMGARPLGSTRIIVGVAAVIRAFIAWDILTRFQTPLVVRMPVGDWLPEPDSLAIQLVVGVWLGSAIAFTIGYRVTESGITAPLATGSGDEAVRRALRGSDGGNGVAITNVTSRPEHPRRHWVRARVFAPICSKLAFLGRFAFFSERHHTVVVCL